ncbi:YcgL domain-containing protein [Parashewanella spongiae]|uniref:YcgL domain-containing protein D5R81_04110 n=1 Tax=Parashewanella spongiae TaxID=342950 RepID=A0A3A6TRE4_9GAMM|nr:YcgL domain-containing protein [Parashewanella spongiae]MCL1077237.1 YcgL domain-containing protein [Parashewanella spongiae]RJY18684.1 YcgL domain-containing protein [Parashewanella spongiae]
MICAVYKSSLKEETYLFIEKKGQFDNVPEPLLAMFGTPQLLMLLPLSKREKLGIADINRVKEEILNKGFYLQIPPPKENLLDIHRKELGVEA